MPYTAVAWDLNSAVTSDSQSRDTPLGLGLLTHSLALALRYALRCASVLLVRRLLTPPGMFARADVTLFHHTTNDATEHIPFAPISVAAAADGTAWTTGA